MMAIRRWLFCLILCCAAALPLSAGTEQPAPDSESAAELQLFAAQQHPPAAQSQAGSKSAKANKEFLWHEVLPAQAAATLRMMWERTLAAAYHPFLSFKDIHISIAALLKFIFLIILALLLLRMLRGKTAAMLERRTRLTPGTAASVATLGYYAAAALVFLVILNTVGINLTQLTVIFGALGIGIGFGLQAIMNNFVSGIILLAERVIKTGDIVNLDDGLIGEVKHIAIRATVIRTVNGNDVIVPNSEFISGRVNSWTYGDDWRRLSVPFGVSYDADPDEVARLAAAAARAVEITREDEAHPVLVFFEGFGDSSLNFCLKVWCRMRLLRPGTGLHSDYYFALFRKFKEAGIEIPFPQRDLRLRSVSPAAAELLRPEKNSGSVNG
jgi:small-conductance mechanosensitive channel